MPGFISPAELAAILAEVDSKVLPGIEAVWLTGSRARGEAGPHSDWDVLVIHPDAPDDKYRVFAAGSFIGTGPDGNPIQVLWCASIDSKPIRATILMRAGDTEYGSVERESPAVASGALRVLIRKKERAHVMRKRGPRLGLCRLNTPSRTCAITIDGRLGVRV